MIRGLKIRFILMAMIGLLALMACALLLKEGSRVAADAQKTEWLQQANRMADDILQVNQAMGEMDELTRSVSYVTSEQRQGTDQVVIAVESLSRSSMEAATATEQVSRTADDLSMQARDLQAAISRFRLAETRIEALVSLTERLTLPVESVP